MNVPGAAAAEPSLAPACDPGGADHHDVDLPDRAQREDLLCTVAHDLRGPLTAIQAHGQRLQRLLEQAACGERAQQCVEAILTAAQRMSAMVTDLAESGGLAAGRLQLDRQPLGLRYFVAGLLARSGGTLAAGTIQVDVPDLPPVEADPLCLERILTNLLTNALKYSPAGSTVRIGAVQAGSEVMVSITDQGTGIHPDDLPRLFCRFFRARDVRRTEGLGLGLYITRMLVEAHGGRIWAESRLGVGSTFYFTLPLRTADRGSA